VILGSKYVGFFDLSLGLLFQITYFDALRRVKSVADHFKKDCFKISMMLEPALETSLENNLDPRILFDVLLASS